MFVVVLRQMLQIQSTKQHRTGTLYYTVYVIICDIDAIDDPLIPQTVLHL